MGSEAALWRKLWSEMKVFADVQRHEDLASTGIPDVSFGIPTTRTQGWIELKQMDHWPTRRVKGITLGLTADQIEWLERRGSTGASCWALAQVGTIYYWYRWKDLWRFDPAQGAELHTATEGIDLATLVVTSLRRDEIYGILTSN